MDKNTSNERRQFLIKAGKIAGLAVSMPVAASFISSCEQNEDPIPAPPPSTVPVDLSRYPAIAAAGGVVKILIPGKNNNNSIVISRLDNNQFSVVDSICQHAGCEVDLPFGESNELKCPCHFVTFSKLDGQIVKNPLTDWAGVPLKKFNANYKIEQNILEIEI